jgi:hypothetical protein
VSPKAELALTGNMRIGAFEFTPTGMIVHGKPTFAETARIGEFIRLVNKGSQWWWGAWLNYGEGRFGERFAQVVEATGWEPKTIQQYAWVERAVPIANRLDDVPFGHYANTIASLPVPEQKNWAARAADEGWSQRDLKRNVRAALKKPLAGARTGTDERYRVFYAEPNWTAIDELLQYRFGDPLRLVRERSEDHAVLFLWCPEPYRFAAAAVLEAWGFEHKSAMIWHHSQDAFGSYVAIRHQHLLIATKGRCLPDRPTPAPGSVQAHRGSAADPDKPEIFRTHIEGLYDGPYVELFARRQTPGWTCIGVEDFVL